MVNGQDKMWKVIFCWSSSHCFLPNWFFIRWSVLYVFGHLLTCTCLAHQARTDFLWAHRPHTHTHTHTSSYNISSHGHVHSVKMKNNPKSTEDSRYSSEIVQYSILFNMTLANNRVCVNKRQKRAFSLSLSVFYLIANGVFY